MTKIIQGTVKNNTGEKYVNSLEGIRVLCITFPSDCYQILTGATEEDHEKYIKALFKNLCREEGIETLTEFRKAYSECDALGAGISPQNLIDIEEYINVDKVIAEYKI